MARKKNFKQGLDNIIQESINLFNSDGEIEQEEINKLKAKINLLERELFLWRTGKLTIDKFHQSLSQHGLKYNPDTNQIEKD